MLLPIQAISLLQSAIIISTFPLKCHSKGTSTNFWSGSGLMKSLHNLVQCRKPILIDISNMLLPVHIKAQVYFFDWINKVFEWLIFLYMRYPKLFSLIENLIPLLKPCWYILVLRRSLKLKVFHNNFFLSIIVCRLKAIFKLYKHLICIVASSGIWEKWFRNRFSDSRFHLRKRFLLSLLFGMNLVLQMSSSL